MKSITMNRKMIITQTDQQAYSHCNIWYSMILISEIWSFRRERGISH
uniref:Uncharacterized protein n=1 Tax=Anguilla anguilla TaxID=7936 RepID=A0A0E9U0L4_ANGAN